jgi:hypothetical protein
MKVIYIAGPYGADTPWDVEQNVRRAEEVSLAVAECGAMPLCPHTNTRFFDGQLTHDFWLEGTMELMRRCDAVLFIDNWRDSHGSVGEWDEAEALDMPRFDGFDEFAEWMADAQDTEISGGLAHKDKPEHPFNIGEDPTMSELIRDLVADEIDRRTGGVGGKVEIDTSKCCAHGKPIKGVEAK